MAGDNGFNQGLLFIKQLSVYNGDANTQLESRMRLAPCCL